LRSHEIWTTVKPNSFQSERAKRLKASSPASFGWFDYNASDQHRLVLLQGDKRQAGDSSDGVVARRQVAQVFAHSLNSSEALRKTFELTASKGPAQDDFEGPQRLKSGRAEDGV
jgi:hypothetical protein